MIPPSIPFPVPAMSPQHVHIGSDADDPMEEDEATLVRKIHSGGASYPARVDSLRTLMERPLLEIPAMMDVQFTWGPDKQSQALTPVSLAYRPPSMEIPAFQCLSRA